MEFFTINNNHRITLNTNKNIIVEFTNERIIPASGLAVVGTLLGKSNFIKKLNRMGVTSNRSQHQIKNGDIVLTYLGMLCMGKPYFEAVHEMDDDKDFYKTALANGLVPVDIDVTPMDNSKSKKEGVSRTYKGFDGYAPMMAYIGTEGYAINFELREGKQHCQKGTVEFLQETIKLCHKLTDKPLLIRLDSGNDSIDNVAVLMDTGCFFIIKRNLRRESTDDWFEMAKQYFQNVNSPRDGKTVYIGSDWKTVTSKQFNKEFTLRTGYEITERTIDKYGQFNLVPDVEVETWWTNLGDPDEEIIRLYHAHGECEQFHSEVKTDMDLERLPSGKFATNALILELGMIAYNILRMIGQGTIGERAPRQKRDVKRRRLRTVISNLIMMAGHVTMHARQLIIGLGKSNVWRHIFSDICQKYAVTNA